MDDGIKLIRKYSKNQQPDFSFTFYSAVFLFVFFVGEEIHLSTITGLIFIVGGIILQQAKLKRIKKI